MILSIFDENLFFYDLIGEHYFVVLIKNKIFDRKHNFADLGGKLYFLVFDKKSFRMKMQFHDFRAKI